VKGRIVASGGPELADQLERDGYAAFSDDADGEPASGAAAGSGSGSSLDDLFRL
jgi:Fe-S cluster assembly ATP-binding protein